MNFKRYFATIFIFFIGGGALAQTDDPIGKWLLDINKAIEIMDPTVKAHYDTLPEDIKNRAISRMNAREFIFLENGKITVNWKSQKGQQVSEGDWQMDASLRRLSITIDNRRSDYSYEILSSGDLVLKPKDKRGLFDNLYLLKVN